MFCPLHNLTLQDKKLGDVPAYKALLTTFNGSEIVRWPAFQLQYKDEIAAETEVFSGVCTVCTHFTLWAHCIQELRREDDVKLAVYVLHVSYSAL